MTVLNMLSVGFLVVMVPMVIATTVLILQEEAENRSDSRWLKRRR